jgi:hypothetical protein
LFIFVHRARSSLLATAWPGRGSRKERKEEEEEEEEGCESGLLRDVQ